jgi:hypothetical protein
MLSKLGTILFQYKHDMKPKTLDDRSGLPDVVYLY